VRRYFKGRFCKAAGLPFKIPYGAEVEVVRFLPRRRVIIEYDGERLITFATLLRKGG